MFEGRQARNFTTNVPKILDLKSSSEQLFSENWRWVPLLARQKMWFCQADTMNTAYSYPGTHKRAPFLNLLQLVWGKTKKQYGNRYVYVFRGKQAHDPNTTIMVPHVSATFRSMTLKNKNKLKVIAASRLNQITIPSQIVLCKFLLINLRH